MPSGSRHCDGSLRSGVALAAPGPGTIQGVVTADGGMPYGPEARGLRSSGHRSDERRAGPLGGGSSARALPPPPGVLRYNRG